ncbi:Diaminohydroxyphosphoribosylaminopyrimidine deaminase / 5-amino-6-(5-phosphoribosylamino)uracil reductase [hydrothermal vent metagenome]|uniref:Diaminohydroxyphosphoribosylaminopyrimidine deaminase / 5-amino-6-(5-phosphoribosylamino)uracil reductase n=1 Tax=hydrothermal vent metagenome TaxID=652676 RepID=A0A3B0ZNG9_9ZZZZ
MAQALRLAHRGINTTHPNPRVGCVLVIDEQVIAEGWHVKTGESHAEIVALQQATITQGATAYVTLEPCCHQGRTGACTSALINAGIKRVVVAMRDPFPEVAGRGIEILREAGVQVDVGLMQEEAIRLNTGFVKRLTTGYPWVRSKIACSLDGRTAAGNGESKWITSDLSRQDVQQWRARSSAIMTGIGTVIADDPSLNVRHKTLSDDAFQQPLRVVLDSTLRMKPSARMLALPGRTLIFTTRGEPHCMQALRDAGATVVVQQGEKESLDLQEVLSYLAKKESMNEILLEAGATLNGAFMEAGYIDEFLIYMAPSFMGGDARGLFNTSHIESLSDQVKLQINEVRQLGSDIRIRAFPCRNNEVA